MVEFVVACPQCGRPNRHFKLTSITGWTVRVWSDGWRDPVPPPCVLHRCGACGAVGFRAEFSDLGQLLRPTVECDVELVTPGSDRVRVMHTLRRFTDADLQRAKSWMEAAPIAVSAGLREDEAERFADALREAGAVCTVDSHEVEAGSIPAWFAAPGLEDVEDVETMLARLADSSLDGGDEMALRLALYQHWNATFREGFSQWVPGHERDSTQQDNARRLAELLRGDDPCERLLKANLARERADYSAAASLLAEDFGDFEPLAACVRTLVEERQSHAAILDPGRAA